MKRTSTKRGRIIASIGAASVLAVGGLGVAAAHADPSGCSAASTLKVSAIGKLKAKATATCSGSATRTLVAEIKWDKNILPDPLVAKDSTTASATTYKVKAKSCDHGATRSYYSRGYFTSTSSDQHDSSHIHVTTCS